MLIGGEQFIPGRYVAGTVHRRGGGEDDTDEGEEGRLDKLHDGEGLEDVMRLVTAAWGKEQGELTFYSQQISRWRSVPNP